MKAKDNFVENKPKHKFMNPKGKKFKKPNHSFSFKLLNLSPLNQKTLARRPMEDSATSVGESITWHIKCFNRKKEPVKAQPRGNGRNGRHKVKMVELNTDSFRLDSSLPIVNSITFSSDWWLDS